MQRELCEAVRGYVGGGGRAGTEAAAVLAAWADVLDDLVHHGPAGVADRLDWAAKLALLEGYRTRDGLGWDHPKLAQVDLAWAELGSGNIVDRLLAAGRLRPGPADAAAVASALTSAPADTRAATRGRWITDHVDHVVAAGWDSLLVRDSGGGLHPLRMVDPFDHADPPAGAVPDHLIRWHGTRQVGSGPGRNAGSPAQR